MNNDIVTASEEVFKKLDGVYKFGSKYGEYPYQEVGRIVAEMKKLADSLPDIEIPENQDQLIKSELKRKLNGEAYSLEQYLTPNPHDFETLVSMHGIPESDINGLENWLTTNRDKTLEAVERLYQTKNIQNYELSLPVDIPAVRRQSEEVAARDIQRYHKRLGKLLQDLTQVGEFLRDINAVPTTKDRSYFHQLTNTLAIEIPGICFTTEDGEVQVRERDLITLYGHEGMGHALNQIVTKNNGLPYFLTKDSLLTRATGESVAQFYQNVIFEDLKNSHETQRDLGIQHKFEEIYREAKDIAQLKEYKLKLFQYAITVLADKDLGDPQDPFTLEKKVELLGKVAISPTYSRNVVEQYRYKFDSQGNLNSELVSELMYCAQPVQRALEEFAKQGIQYEGKGRSKIDETLLKGFWTPIGFVDNARLKAQNV
ncbi:MAG: hypothetical protein ABIH25_02435 [Candidatus Woesearchaeota archaeon]